MTGCSTRTIEYNPNTNYYELCAECLEACEAWVEGGCNPDTKPQTCIGCPFED